MNPSDRMRSWADAVLFWGAIATVAYLMVVAFYPGSWPQLALRTTAGGALPNQVLKWQQMDREALNAVQNSGTRGNIVADLRSSAAAGDVDRDYLATFYSRAVYTLWPRRMYITHPSIVINSGRQIDAAPRLTDRLWMMQHNVGAAVRFDLAGN